ncbi:MAG: hypothetical protein DSZ28_03330 [Thiothrix sp.]|nr:MAG: hypothetical protein DSZ28_03330 [Thiothrix sp.]
MSREETEEVEGSESSPSLAVSSGVAHPNPSTPGEIAQLLQDVLAKLSERFDHMERKLLNAIDKRLERFESRLYDAERRADVLEKEIKQVRKENAEKDTTIRTLSRQMREQCCELDDKEQYQRRDNVRIVGLPEKKNETTDECEKVVRAFFKKDLGIDRNIEISIAHRIGKPQNDSHRPILCRLVKRQDKAVILRGRKQLREKGLKVFISEDMTVANQRLIRDLKQNERVVRVWTHNCKINVLGANDKRLFNVTRDTDVNALLDRHNRA